MQCFIFFPPESFDPNSTSRFPLNQVRRLHSDAPQVILLAGRKPLFHTTKILYYDRGGDFKVAKGGRRSWEEDRSCHFLLPAAFGAGT